MPAITLFAKQNFLNLETFRKTGKSVPTPVWFIQDGDMLYVRTGAESGKVKRIRANGRARIAPCKADGALLGEWVEAKASLVKDPALIERVNQLYNQKYGLQKTFFDLLNWFGRRQWTTIALRVE